MSGPATIVVEVGRACTACGACLLTCPRRALIRAPSRPEVNPVACDGCMECLEVCPTDAIRPADAAGSQTDGRDGSWG
ncbi:MAG: hypothetical protein KatS3mg008_0788 [Acidimicrobiales bacterium]|nr:MAG: hypothetical protein KatS3mg008_0788 [Acidimicrobiales bacterium]